MMTISESGLEHGRELLSRLYERTADQDHVSRRDIVLLQEVLKKMDDHIFVERFHVQTLSIHLKQEQDRNQKL